jgi:hypothetical protein
MAIKCTKIIHSKAFQNNPKMGFWYANIPFGKSGMANHLKYFEGSVIALGRKIVLFLTSMY